MRRGLCAGDIRGEVREAAAEDVLESQAENRKIFRGFGIYCVDRLLNRSITCGISNTVFL